MVKTLLTVRLGVQLSIRIHTIYRHLSFVKQRRGRTTHRQIGNIRPEQLDRDIH